MKAESRFYVDDNGKACADLIITPVNEGERSLLEGVFGEQDVVVSTNKQYIQMDYMERSIFGPGRQRLNRIVLEIRPC